MINALLYMARTGLQGRMLPYDLAAAGSGIRVLAELEANRAWSSSMMRCECKSGSKKTARRPGDLIVDSQSVQTAEKGACDSTHTSDVRHQAPNRRGYQDGCETHLHFFFPNGVEAPQAAETQQDQAESDQPRFSVFHKLPSINSTGVLPATLFMLIKVIAVRCPCISVWVRPEAHCRVKSATIFGSTEQ